MKRYFLLFILIIFNVSFPAQKFLWLWFWYNRSPACYSLWGFFATGLTLWMSLKILLLGFKQRFFERRNKFSAGGRFSVGLIASKRVGPLTFLTPYGKKETKKMYEEE